MSVFENLISQGIVHRLGWTLLHFVWQGAALALVPAVGLWLLRRRSAGVRYLAGCVPVVASPTKLVVPGETHDRPLEGAIAIIGADDAPWGDLSSVFPEGCWPA